ncbi:unnamed protein product [Moneuplotes crassus]|uniref:Uncharacterized protein n=1 Tax=Euplotes crassus TaxID=5936 RepID=A0AAD2CW64_EUPCR|nr:unnamed protein product [Moneuplotes crassus]
MVEEKDIEMRDHQPPPSYPQTQGTTPGNGMYSGNAPPTGVVVRGTVVGQPQFPPNRHQQAAAAYDLIRAENSRNNWKTIIYIGSFGLIILGSLTIIGNIFGIIGDMLTNEKHSVHYTKTDSMTSADFLGIGGFFIDLLEIGRGILIAFQGYLGYKTTVTNTALAAQSLIKKSFWLLTVNLALILIQMIIGTVSISKDKRYNSAEEDETYGFFEVDDIYEIAMSIVIATFFFTCCCTLCCCGVVIGGYHMYKQSHETYDKLSVMGMATPYHTG